MALVAPEPEFQKTGANVPTLVSRIRGCDGRRSDVRRSQSARLTPQTHDPNNPRRARSQRPLARFFESFLRFL